MYELRFRENLRGVLAKVNNPVDAPQILVKIDLDDPDQHLHGLLLEISKDHAQFMQAFFLNKELLPKLQIRLKDYDLIAGYQPDVQQDMIKFFSNAMNNLPNVCLKLKEMQQKHTEAAEAVVSQLNFDPKQLSKFNSILKEHCTDAALDLCRLLFVMKDARMLHDYGLNNQELIDSVKYLLPQELLDYLNIRVGVTSPKQEELKPEATDLKKDTETPIIPAQSPPSSSVSSTSSSSSLSDIKPKKMPAAKKASSLSKPPPPAPRDRTDNTSFTIGRSEDARGVIARLVARGLRIIRTRGDHVQLTNPTSGQTVTVPSSSREGLPTGTRINIEYDANAVLGLPSAR